MYREIPMMAMYGDRLKAILDKEAESILEMLLNDDENDPRCPHLRDQLMGWTDFGASDFDTVVRELPHRWNRLRRFILHMLALSENSLLCTSLRSQLQLLLKFECIWVFPTPRSHQIPKIWTIGGILFTFITRCRHTEKTKSHHDGIHIIREMRSEAEKLYKRLPCHAERPLSDSSEQEGVV